METTKDVPVEGEKMKTFIFTIALEQDEEGWRAFYAPLEHLGASTWGESKAEALQNIQEVLSMILEEFQEDGKTIPSTEGLTVTERTAVAITR
jgi:predicted RNase H-like HicB family nuclease